MEQFGLKGLDGLSEASTKKWYGPMGLIGLIVFATALIVPLPVDLVVVAGIGLVLMGWGFGNAECRTFQETINREDKYKITREVWQWTGNGIALFLVGAGGAGMIGLRLSGHI